jgi:cytochrome c oxidase cbb3-type subunit III
MADDVPNDERVLPGHDADGITELDNKLPRWWVYLFYFSIIFAIVYMLYFHVLGLGRLSRAGYEQEMQVAKERFPAAFETLDLDSGELAASTDPAVLARGKELFAVNCVACHLADGGGLIGPNLCDDYFIHGHTYADALRTVNNGVLEKGMIAWKTMMPPKDIEAVTSYTFTLLGTTPANPKEPQGDRHVVE